MNTAIKEFDMIRIRLINRANGQADDITACVVAVDTNGVMVDTEWESYPEDQHSPTWTFVPWSNIMACVVLRAAEDGSWPKTICDTYDDLNYAAGFPAEDPDGEYDVMTLDERRHRELLKAQKSVAFYNGDL